MATTITSQNLTPTEQVPLADATVDPSTYTSSITQSLADITNQQTQAQANVDQLNQQGQQDTSSLASLQSLLGGKGTDIATTYQDQGVTKLYNQLSDLNAQATGLNLESQAIPIQKQEANRNTGATDRGVAPQTAGALRLNALKALSLGQQAAIASSQYDKAKNYADQIINAKYAQIEADINAKKTNLEGLKDFKLTPAEEKLRQATLAKTNKEAEILTNLKEKEKLNSTTARDYAKYAMDAGQSDIASQLVALDPASKTFQQDLSKLQAQIKNPMLELDIALKKAQLQQTQAQTNKIYKETGLLGEASAKEKEEEKKALASSKGQVDVLSEKVSLIDSILNSKGMDSRVGTTVFNRGLFAIKDKVTGEGQQFSGAVHKLASQEFINALVNAKGQGATFGALTEKEGDALRAAATQINDWEIKDNDGKPTGAWNVDEASFKKELENLKRLANKGIANANGSVFDQSESSILDSAFSPASLPASSFFQ